MTVLEKTSRASALKILAAVVCPVILCGCLGESTVELQRLESSTEPSPANPVPETQEPETPLDTATWWKPLASQNLTWQWQLQDEIDTSFDVDVYNVDMSTSAEKVAELKTRGVKVICYFSAGTVESFRPDAAQFSPSIQGEQYEDLFDEKWLDYRDYQRFASVMRDRMDTCKSKGFDAIELDNVDAHNYQSRDANGNVVNIGTNFNISLVDSRAYVSWLAAEAHSRGLGVGLKNAEEMAADIVTEVDWMLVEDCFYDSWCNAATVFIENNKAVFMAEYDNLVPDFAPACELAKSLGYSAIWRDASLALDTYLACE